MKLIVGLGNPGDRYEETRHNVGFQVIDALAQKAGIDLSSTKFDGDFGQGGVKGEKVALLKPQTYMNCSGDSVGPAARFYKVMGEDLIVVHDELDMPLGRLQLRKGGGTGGHHGLDSIVERLGTDDFIRIRVGIGKPETKERTVGHVLGGFTKEEAPLWKETSDKAVAAIEAILKAGLAKAMNDFNRRSS
ncbi:MAG: aminoacyl-tRNA hydrolase [Myxococcales bacterium]